MRIKATLAAALGLGMLLASCSSSPDTPERMTVAAYAFEENELIAEIYAVVLENAGIEVERTFDYTTREVLSEDFTNGTVDLVPDYLGSVTETANTAINGPEAEDVATGDTEATAQALRDLLEPYGVVVTDPAPAQNQLQFAVRAADAQEQDLATLSDLAAVSGELVFGGPAACQGAEFCLGGLKEVYDITFQEVVELDTAGPNTLNALEVGDIDVGMVFATDPAVDQRGFVVLEDDRDLEVANNVVALVGSESASEEVLELIGSVEELLTTAELRAAHGRVSIEGYPPQWVAASWAAEQGLIPAEAVPASPTPTPPPSPTPSPEPEPEPEPAAAPAPAPAPAPNPSGGGGGSWSRNMGEPSGAAQARNWPGLAQCESGGNPSIVSSNGLYHGLYQFSVPTWQSMGGSGAASSASSGEQTYRAQILYDRAGPGQWPHCQRFL